MEDVSQQDAARSTEADPIREISLLEIANVLLRNRRLLLGLPLLIGGVMATLALSQDRTYSASAILLPHQAGSSGGGAAVAMARQFGLDVGAGDPGQSPAFYVELLQGREILREAAELEYTVPEADGDGTRVASLIEYWQIEPGGVAPVWQRAVEYLKSQMDTRVNPSTGTVELRVSAATPELAEQIALRLLGLLSEFNLQSRQTQAHAETRFVAERLDEARAELRRAEDEFQSFLRQNRQVQNSPELLFEHDRLQRQVAMRQQVLNSLALSYEQARIEGVRDTPVFTIVEGPEGSAVPNGRGTVARTVLGLLIGFLLAGLIALSREFTARSSHGNRDDFREFDRLKREALADLRNPTRLLRRGRAPKTEVAA